MSDIIIKNCRMNWKTEVHKFTFVTGECSVATAECIEHLINSLENLRQKIADGDFEWKNPIEIKVEGASAWTYIDNEPYDKDAI